MIHAALLAASLFLTQTTGTFGDGPMPYKDTPLGVTLGGAAFTAVAINTAAVTDAVKVKGYRYIKWQLNYTYNAATAVTMTCQNSENGTTWSDIHVLQYAAFPVATSQPQVWSYAAGANKIWDWMVAVRGVYMRCSFVGTGSPTASDVLTVTARGGVGP